MSGGTTYEFVSWSDGGAATHNISTPASNTTYTATYRVATGGTGNGLSATYFNNIDFTGTTVTRVDPTVDFVWGSGSPAAGHRRRHVQRALDGAGRGAVHGHLHLLHRER